MRAAIAVVGISCLLCCASVSQAALCIDFTTQPSLLYGNFFSFSLALNHNVVTLIDQQGFADGSSPGPGDPFYVASSPGQISGGIVIGAGSMGNPIETNFSGMDDAYVIGGGSSTHFDTTTQADPGTGGGGTPPALDNATTWDADVAALRAALNGNAFLIVFDHNETGGTDPSTDDNSGGFLPTDLIAWAEVTLSGSPTLSDATFFFSAFDDPFTVPDERAAGLAASAIGGPDPDPATNNSGTSLGTLDPQWGIAHSHVTILPDGTFLHFGPPTGADPANAVDVNQNIGQNQAEFAVYNPILDALIQSSDYEHFSINIRLSRENDGNEQIFIPLDSKVVPPFVIPEPGSVAIWSVLGVVGLAASRRRRRRA